MSRPDSNPVPYSKGILGDPIDLSGRPSKRKQYPNVAADAGLEVTHQASGVIGTVVAWTDAYVDLRDDGGRDRRVRNTPGSFLIEGAPSTLVRPTQTDTVKLSASGSVASAETARVARASRILVEGIHDAELLEKVWGDDLRSVGVVVEPMSGADDLAEIVRTFKPAKGRRLGILLDHLVEGSKESRIAAEVNHPEVMIAGHEFVDVWEAVRPKVVGIDRWPTIPMGTPWKEGICAHLGADEPALFWRSLLNRVNSFADLEPSLIGAVEQLIDFTAAEG